MFYLGVFHFSLQKDLPTKRRKAQRTKQMLLSKFISQSVFIGIMAEIFNPNSICMVYSSTHILISCCILSLFAPTLTIEGHLNLPLSICLSVHTYRYFSGYVNNRLQ